MRVEVSTSGRKNARSLAQRRLDDPRDGRDAHRRELPDGNQGSGGCSALEHSLDLAQPGLTTLRSRAHASMLPAIGDPEQAIKEAQEQQLRPVYLLVGDERHLEAKVVQALRAAASKGGIPGLNEDQIQAQDSDVETALSAARTLPMMAKRRFVLIRGLEHWEPREGSEAKEKANAPARSAARVHPKPPHPAPRSCCSAAASTSAASSMRVPAKMAGW